MDEDLQQFLNDDISKIVSAIKKETPVTLDYKPAERIEKPPVIFASVKNLRNFRRTQAKISRMT